MHFRRGSKERLEILAKESIDRVSSLQSSIPSPSKVPRSPRLSSPAIAWITLTVLAALLIISPALTLQDNRSLLEKNASSLRTKQVPPIIISQTMVNSKIKEVRNTETKLQNAAPMPESNTAPVSAQTGAVVEDMNTAQLESPPTKIRTTKPTILIHIGPPKTGTTTLQCHLGLNFAKMVEQDNFYYLGTWYAPLCGLPLGHNIPGFANAPRPMLLDCYAPHIHKECNKDERWNEFGELIQHHYDLGHNLIVSDEMFHHHFQREDVHRLKSLLEESSWNVKIMYTYRHFYSSIPSMYHQLNDPYATEKGMANAVEKTLWPSTDDGYRIRSFRESNDFVITNDMRRFSYWVEEFGTVQVFNMESTKGDYLSSFLCTMMPELKASNSCSSDDVEVVVPTDAATADSSSRNDNGSAKKFLHYDMLAVAAKDAGLLDGKNLQRSEVRDAVQHYCEENGWNDLSNNFALDCLSDPELESFLQASLEQAKMMQEYFLSTTSNQKQDWPLLEEEIRTGFWKFAERKQFCSIDTVASLQGERWQTFFQQL
ncbi:MAG: hypothetical protein SGBAC_009983, partial [Bacillariaceae sp.]